MNLHEKKHYYGFSGLPNYWVDDKDNRYSDEFFDDKTYKDLHFDNFFDMDKMFGHENSLFGTRGLPVGHPDRTSKSFDQYNKTYGPMIVRVVNDNTLQEQTNRIKQMMGVINEDIPTSIRRRKHIIDALLKIIIDNSYPCDFADDESFLQGILYDLSYQVEVEGLPVGDLKDYIIEYFADDIQAYYINKTKDCDEI